MQLVSDGTEVVVEVNLRKKLRKKSSLSSKVEVGFGSDEGRCTGRVSVLVRIYPNEFVKDKYSRVLETCTRKLFTASNTNIYTRTYCKMTSIAR